jgi:hypothetical protein
MHGWEIVIRLTQSTISFSEKQQLSKSEYLRTQQPTFTHRIGKSDIMEYVELRVFCKKVFFDAGLFCKTFYHF